MEVSLDCSDVVRDFVGDPIDVGFRILRPSDSSMVARRIARLPAVCVASPDYLRRHGTPTRPSDLSRHACIAYRHPGSGAIEPMRFRVGGRDQSATPRPSLVVNDVETGCRAATLGLGLGIAQPPAYYVQQELTSGELIPILDRHAPPPWTLYLCYPGAKQLPHRVRAFIDFARDALATERFS